MNIHTRIVPVLILAAVTTFTACKKNTESDNNTEASKHADDQNIVSNQFNAIATDINIALETSPAFSGKVQGALGTICDATIAYDSVSNPRTLTLTYDGSLTCHPAWKRTGTVIVSMAQGVQWKNAGASITVTYQNVKITRIQDNKSITISGAKTFTNVTGGLLYNLAALQTIIHTVSSGGMSIKFDDNTARNWKVARKHTFTYDGGVVLSITGNHTEGNTTGVAEWGVNRFDHTFTTSITQPLVIRQDCSFRLTGGQVKHDGIGTATATFGLNASGTPTSCPGLGLYYMKLSWTGPGGNTYTAILPY
ncbi:MAG TPA: hypothetical protein VD993_19170 [Chitinophagaceae bacterium]|nr:hypothetical protein [Chitinophagaceae bacterium]